METGNTMPAVILGDVKVLERVVSDGAAACLEPGTDAIECIGDAYTEDGSSKLASPSKKGRPASAIGFDLSNQKPTSGLLQTDADGENSWTAAE